jgi:hypothetical protein
MVLSQSPIRLQGTDADGESASRRLISSAGHSTAGNLQKIEIADGTA